MLIKVIADLFPIVAINSSYRWVRDVVDESDDFDVARLIDEMLGEDLADGEGLYWEVAGQFTVAIGGGEAVFGDEAEVPAVEDDGAGGAIEFSEERVDEALGFGIHE